MRARTEAASTDRAGPTSGHPIYVNNEGLSSKKTAFIIVTVVGCIAILWPKVFHPMMFGENPVDIQKSSSNLRTQGVPPLGCCYNATPMVIGPHLYRKQYNLYTGEMSLRQERPAHMHPDSIYQAMRERGRAIPAMPTIPIVDRSGSANKPKFVEGRPGPLPGMRPPMGAGAIHQPQTKGSTSMGFIMPLYTIGIIVFFGYTIMKVVFKKQSPYGVAPTDPQFRKEVFGNKNGRHIEEINNGSKLGWREHQTITAIQGLIDAADEQLKLREENATTCDLILKKSNENSTSNNIADITSEHKHSKNNMQQEQHGAEHDRRKQRAGSSDRSISVLGMEVTASCEGGKKWTRRPPTPVFFHHNEHSKGDLDDDHPAPQSIYLEGTLAHESKILVSDSETKQEEIYDDFNGTEEEPAVVLSSKMTLSLINLDAHHDDKDKQNEVDSPLGDDIEIISSYEN